MNPTRFGFIGLGLIGGSIARSIRRFHPASHILAFDSNQETLTLALENGIINSACTTIDTQFGTCDYIFLCAPVSHNIAALASLKNIISPSCVLTDAGSVKTAIHEEAQRLGLEESFIGGHPMAGSEQKGFECSTDHLIENAYYILTPSGKTGALKLSEYRTLVSSIGAIPLVLDYHEHDCITAAVSHLPHIIASSLVNLIKDHDSASGIMKMIAAGGFKDITRIASSSPVMWQQICLSNNVHISSILSQYINSLEDIKGSIDSADGSKLYDLFHDSGEYRDSIPDGSLGPIKKFFAVYCDIIDEAGAIATIATILASNHISIKNIGIIHNREFEEGVLRIEFYEEECSHRAVVLLRRYRYTVIER